MIVRDLNDLRLRSSEDLRSPINGGRPDQMIVSQAVPTAATVRATVQNRTQRI